VVVLHPRDAEAATAGEADRLLVLSAPEVGGRSPEPAAVSAIMRETDLPVRVVLLLVDGLSTTVGEFARLVALARDYRVLGASGGLTTEHVPGLIRAGVRQFSLGEEARPDGSWTKAYVATDFVRAWRMLLDDAYHRALGTPVD
jgi:hypothetical protein